jgi:hypothetical protein
MTPFFQKKVDRRSRSAMVDFLKGHYRYNTMSSWNRLTSYANNIKIHRLGLSSEQDDKAYEMLNVDFWEEIRGPIDDFTYDQGHRYTICSNGRSGGYLVLHESNLELTGHLSYCPTCGQRNFKKVPPVTYQDNNEEVIAHEILRSQNSWLPGVYLSQPAIQTLPLSDDKKLLLINRLKSELRDCSATDACCVCSNFIALLDDYDVVEVTEHRPIQVKTLVARAA